MKILVVPLVAILAACATSQTSYAPDGKPMHVISCNGKLQGSEACVQKAGDLCGAKGYTVLGANGEAIPYSAAYGSASGSANRATASVSAVNVQSSGVRVIRTLYVRCNA